MSLFKDLLPFMFTALAACAVAYVAASFVHGLLLRMAIKIVVTTLLYIAAMKVSGAQVMKECVNYLTHKKANTVWGTIVTFSARSCRAGLVPAMQIIPVCSRVKILQAGYLRSFYFCGQFPLPEWQTS